MSISHDIVLLLTHSGDYFTIDRVAEALLRLGVYPFRLDTDRFPMAVKLVAQISNSKLNYRLEYGEQSINTEQVRAVWMRRIWQPYLSQDLAPQFQTACAQESSAALRGFLNHIQEAPWLDNLQKIEQAENKLWQLEVASKVGLRIPRTLVTNKPEEVREFFLAVEGQMIAKLLTPLSTSMEGSSFFLYTSTVKEEDLLEAEATSL